MKQDIPRLVYLIHEKFNSIQLHDYLAHLKFKRW